MVDGWMLLFGGSGCFMRWGYDCWVPRLMDRKYWQVGQLAFWQRENTEQEEEMSFMDAIKARFPVAAEEEDATCPYTNRFEAFKAGVADFVGRLGL